MTDEPIRATILTADGLYFDYDDPAPSVTVNAIARGLANTCRFAGQCVDFYSVAEHSIHVSQIVPPEHALAGLFHDAAEAFICDMPKPLKVRLPDYQAVEARIEAAIFPLLGLPVQLPDAVKAADRAMLATEQRQIMNNRDRWHWTSAPVTGLALQCWSPKVAYAFFMDRARELLGKRADNLGLFL